MTLKSDKQMSLGPGLAGERCIVDGVVDGIAAGVEGGVEGGVGG